MSETATFDFIIVGAGSAGCVLANRLSADESARVLLLEAGGDASAPEVRIPALFGTMFGTDMDWAYRTVVQKRTGSRIAIPRGRMLGGSSSLNAMIYVRGNPADYDGWQTQHGATGWGYHDVLPYFFCGPSATPGWGRPCTVSTGSCTYRIPSIFTISTSSG